MIACVVMDLDGSSLDGGGRMPASLSSLMSERTDLAWVVASGRSYASAMRTPPAALSDPGTPHVCDGGAVVAARDRQVLSTVQLPTAQVRRVLDHLDVPGVSEVFASTGLDTAVVWPPDAVVDHPGVVRARSVAELADHAAGAEVTKITAGGPALPVLPRGVTQAVNGGVADVTAAGVDKGSGVEAVLRALGLAPQRCAFVFNDLNDLPVLARPSLAGIHRVKVGPLLPEVDAPTSAPDPSGVARALRALLDRG